jgi:hypothetical protein
MVSAWWLVVVAILGFSLGFLLVAALTMTRDDKDSQLDDHSATDRTLQHT